MIAGHGTATNAAGWAAALDELEAWIDAALDSTATSGPMPANGELGPLPPELAERATAVLARMHDAERELAARRDATRAELEDRRGRSRAAAFAPPRDASYVDRIA